MNKELLRKTALNYGIILGVISVLISVIQYLTGQFDLSGQGSGRWIWMLVSLGLTSAVVIMASKKYKDLGDGFLNFGEGFKLIFTLIIYSTLITVVWIAVYVYVIDSGYQEAILNATHDNLVMQGNEPGTDAYDMGMTWTEKMTAPHFMLLLTIVQSAIFAAILALIFSAFLQKKRPFFDNSSLDAEQE